MKKYVPLLLSSVLAFTSIQSFTVFAEGEDDGNIEEISEEGEEKAVEDTNLRIYSQVICRIIFFNINRQIMRNMLL